MIEPVQFALTLRYSFSFPYATSIEVATLLPILELLLGVGLFVKPYTLPSLYIARTLFSAFAFVHVWDFIVKGSVHPCFCYGSAVALSEEVSIIQVFLLLILTWLPKRVWGLAQTIRNLWVPMSNPRHFLYFATPAVLLLGSAAVVRYIHIDKELQSGLIAQSRTEQVARRLESVLSRFLPHRWKKRLSKSFHFCEKPGV